MHNLDSLVKKLSGKIILDGLLVPALSKKNFNIINPATAKIIASAPLCGSEDIDRAVTKAQAAQRAFAESRVQDRAKILHACAEIVRTHAEELALLMSWETGKALRTESRLELVVAADTFSYYAGLASEIKGESIPFDPKMLVYTKYEPVGVVGAIIPWNVPLMLLAFKLAPALIAGNSVVVKPSPESSLTTLRAAELLNQVLPANLCNIITGDGELTGAALVSHAHIAKISFTGSVESGRAVYKTAAEKLIPVTLELGGKSPLIIMQDADLESCASTAVSSMRFTRQGQSCTAASRIFIHESIYEEFFHKLKNKVDKLIMGDPLDESTDIGSLISKKQFEKVTKFMKLADQDTNITITYCSQVPGDSKFHDGYFVRPALLTNIKNTHELCQQEIFGPVCALISWNNFDDVIKAANDTSFGLAAGIYTKDLFSALQFVNRIEAGFVQVNQYNVVKPMLPFGGYKFSGIGKEACLETVLEHYMRKKTIMINIEHA